LKRLLFALIVPALAMLAPPASAQITTVFTPPRPERPAEDPVERRVQRAEQLERRIGEMREWVDSVAIAVDAEPTVRDTAQVTPDGVAQPRRPAAGQPAPRPREVVARVDEPRAPPRTERFREGAPAPATATPLPLLALLGAATAGLGLYLRRRR
jgi:hypothetical protein